MIAEKNACESAGSTPRSVTSSLDLNLVLDQRDEFIHQLVSALAQTPDLNVKIKKPLFPEDEVDNDLKPEAAINESGVSSTGIFSRQNSGAPAPMNTDKKNQFILQLTAINKHYRKFKNQTSEKISNFFGGNKKTTEGNSRAPAKAKAALDLISLIQENNLTSERILNVFNVNKITADAFCEGKTAKLLSSEFITLLKGPASTTHYKKIVMHSPG